MEVSRMSSGHPRHRAGEQDIRVPRQEPMGMRGESNLIMRAGESRPFYFTYSLHRAESDQSLAPQSLPELGIKQPSRYMWLDRGRKYWTRPHGAQKAEDRFETQIPDRGDTALRGL